MKKFWKIFLFSLLAIILIASGIVYYFLKVKTYDTADEQVEEITSSEYSIVLPDENTAGDTEQTSDTSSSENSTNNDSTNNDDGNSSKSNSDATGKTAVKSTTTTSSNTSKASTNSTTGNTKSTSGEEKEVTVAEIKDKYRPSFENLQNQANDKINALVDRAYSEYQDKRATGESISFGYFYNKYTGAADSLEGKTDVAFQMIYSALKKDLKAHGYSSSHAKEFQEQYDREKASRKKALVNKALDNI